MNDTESSWESNINKQQFNIDYDLIYMKDSLKPKNYTSKASTLTTIIKPQSKPKPKTISSDEESFLNKLHISDVSQSKFLSISKKNTNSQFNCKSQIKSHSHPYFSNIISTLPSFNSITNNNSTNNNSTNNNSMNNNNSMDNNSMNNNSMNNNNSMDNDNESGFIKNRVSSFRIID